MFASVLVVEDLLKRRILRQGSFQSQLRGSVIVMVDLSKIGCCRMNEDAAHDDPIVNLVGWNYPVFHRVCDSFRHGSLSWAEDLVHILHVLRGDFWHEKCVWLG